MKKFAMLALLAAAMLLVVGCTDSTGGSSSTGSEASESSAVVDSSVADSAAEGGEPAAGEESLPDDGEVWADGGPGEPVDLDEIGRQLIPQGARQVAVSEGNMTLEVYTDLSELETFYTEAAEALGAVKDEDAVVEDDGGLQPEWSWIGTYGEDNQKLSIMIYPEEESSRTVIVLY